MKMYLSVILLASTLVFPAYANSNVNASTLPIAAQSNIKQNTKSVTNNWYRYTSKDNTYTVLFPKAPTEQTLENIIMTSYLDETSNIAYFSTGAQFEETQTRNSEQLFDSYLGGFSEGVNVTIKSQIKTTYQGFSAREVTFISKEDNSVAGKIRLVLDTKKSKLYQVMIMAENNNLNAPTVNAFFGSLTIN